MHFFRKEGGTDKLLAKSEEGGNLLEKKTGERPGGTAVERLICQQKKLEKR